MGLLELPFLYSARERRDRIHIVQNALEHRGMDCTRLRDVIRHIPSFTPKPETTEQVDHDTSHVAVSAFTGRVRDNRITAYLMEDDAQLAYEILFFENIDRIHKLISFFGREKAIKSVVMAHVKRMINSHQKEIAEDREETEDIKKYDDEPYLTPENLPHFEHIIDKALMAREFFMAATGETPNQFRGRELLKFPVSIFGVRMIANKNGSAKATEFYPEEERAAVLRDINARLAEPVLQAV